MKISIIHLIICFQNVIKIKTIFTKYKVIYHFSTIYRQNNMYYLIIGNLNLLTVNNIEHCQFYRCFFFNVFNS